MMSRSGLVSSYGGESEISDSEDELNSSSPSYQPTAPVIAVNALGIPVSKSAGQPTSPPAFVRPEVHPAPLPGLVHYHLDEEEDRTAHKEVDNSTAVSEEVFDTTTTTTTTTTSVTLSLPTEQLQGDVTVSSACEGDLPPEPQGRCSNQLQNKILTLLEKKAMGIDLNDSIQNRKDFRNPSIYEKLVSFCKLDEFGSNYPVHVYNPHEWKEDSTYKNLRKAQMKAYEKKEKAKLERTKVEFVTGTKRPPLVSGVLSDPAKKPRRSKWDVSGSGKAETGGSKGSGQPKERPPLLGAAPRGV